MTMLWTEASSSVGTLVMAVTELNCASLLRANDIVAPSFARPFRPPPPLPLLPPPPPRSSSAMVPTFDGGVKRRCVGTAAMPSSVRVSVVDSRLC